MKQELDAARDCYASSEGWPETPAARGLHSDTIKRWCDTADEGNTRDVADDVYVDVHGDVAVEPGADGGPGVLRLPLLVNGGRLERSRGWRSQLLRARQDGCADERAGTG